MDRKYFGILNYIMKQYRVVFAINVQKRLSLSVCVSVYLYHENFSHRRNRKEREVSKYAKKSGFQKLEFSKDRSVINTDIN